MQPMINVVVVVGRTRAMKRPRPNRQQSSSESAAADPPAGSETEAGDVTVNVADATADVTVSSMIQSRAVLPLRTLGAAATRWPPVIPNYMSTRMLWSTHGPGSGIFGPGYPNPFASTATDGPSMTCIFGPVMALTAEADPSVPASHPVDADPAATAMDTSGMAPTAPSSLTTDLE